MISGYFNNDTLLDFAVVSSNTSNQSVAVFLGATGGNLTIPPVYYSTRPSVSSRSICAADVDRDGHVDLVVANYDLNTLSIFKGDGRGVFQTTANTVTLGSAQGPNSIVTADFNDDNIPDLAVSFQTSQSVMMLLGNGGGSFTSKSIVPTNAISSSSPRYLYAADLNHDGRPDTTLGDFGANRVGIFLTQCLATTTSMTTGSVRQLAFEPMVSYTTTVFLGPNAATVGDFNSDSYLDIVTANYDNSSVGVLLGTGNGTFQTQRIFSVGNNVQPMAITVADFNNDGRLDTVVANYRGSNIAVLLGNGNGTLQAQNNMSTGANSKPNAVAVGDFNNDNLLDIAVANYGTNKVGVFLGNGNGNFQIQDTYSTGSSSRPYAVAIGDFSYDNQLDLATANYGTNKIGIFLGIRNGTFQAQTTFLVGNKPSWISVADFNDDSYLDIAVLNSGDNNVGIFLGNGNGVFGTQATFSVGNSTWNYFFAVADLDSDGHLDIVVPNAIEGTISILLGYGDETFQLQQKFSTGANSEPYGLAVGKFNNDNWLDIAVTNYGTNEVGILLRTW
ncbi:unnamed protein product [Rotaria sp. Silwood2]|nr:unnamed protein product [Rotaria sp. Silwood2]